jgi:multiple sugar transport system permease protein
MTTAVDKRRRLTPRWRDYGRPRELVVRYLLLVFVLFITVGPLLWQLLSSLKGAGEDVFGAGASLIPRHPSLRAYREVFDQVPVWTYIRNSVLVALLSITSQLVFSTMAGYMLSKPGWKGRKLVWIVLLASMMFPFESIMVSLFLSVRDMGLVDNLVGVWLRASGSASGTCICPPPTARSSSSPSTPSSAPGTTSCGR